MTDAQDSEMFVSSSSNSMAGFALPPYCPMDDVHQGQLKPGHPLTIIISNDSDADMNANSPMTIDREEGLKSSTATKRKRKPRKKKNATNEPLPLESNTTSGEDRDATQPKVKKKRNRTKNPDPPPETVLPPCKICDEKSSGFHYGVNTCEACKGFFRRTLKKTDVDYKCKCTRIEREKWEQGPFNNSCPACRYERCLAEGMSKNAIKIGRYTNNHKTSNINEAKNIVTQQRQLDRSRESISTVDANASRIAMDIDTDGRTVDNLIATAFAQAVQSSNSPDECPFASDDSFTDSSALFSPMTIDCDTRPSSVANLLSPCTYSNPPSVASSECSGVLRPGCTRFTPDYMKAGLSLKEMDTIIKTLTESHASTQIMDDIPINQIQKQHSEYLEKYNFEKQLFGDMKAVSQAEFMEFYKATGIVVDERMNEVDLAAKFYEKKIALLVAFGKSIPGFKQLSLDDQASLIKSSRLEHVMFSCYRQLTRNADWEKKVLTLPWGQQCHFDEIGRVLSLDLFKRKTEFAKRVKQLDLSLSEEALIRAVVVLFTDRTSSHKLRDAAIIDRIQEQMMACLQHLLNLRHGGPGNRLYKIISLITDLRIVTENEYNWTSKILTEPLVSYAISSYALILEFFS